MSDTLALQIKETKIGETDAAVLQTVFLPFSTQAEEIKAEVYAISVTSIDQVEDMKKARSFRLKLQKLRTDCEKTKKREKEESLRKGQAIDAIYRYITSIIEPMEAHLDKQEKFVELQEAKRVEEFRQSRTFELAALNVDTTIYTNLGEMPEESFMKLLESSRTSFQLAKEAAEKAEKERIAKEEAEAAERERMRVENERLKKEAEAHEALLETERKKAQEEREKAAAEQKKKDDEHKAKLETERLAKKKIEDELAEKNREEDRIARERKESEDRAKRAPDKEKLIELANAIAALRMPEVSSVEAKAIVAKTVETLASASAFLKTQSLAL